MMSQQPSTILKDTSEKIMLGMVHMNVLNVCAEFWVICAETDSSRRQKQANSVVTNWRSWEGRKMMIFITYEYH